MSELGTVVLSDSFDMAGAHLVAASAGTGKTYSIQTLYLRLILSGKTVQEILVVTFTEAATKELRDRIRNVLREAMQVLDQTGDAARDPGDRIIGLLALCPPAEQMHRVSHPLCSHEEAKQRVRLALLDFDLAAIHTIHGFCLRTLKRFAFETGQAFDTTPVTSSTEVVDRFCEDWWRNHVYPMTRERIALIGVVGLTLDSLTFLARRLISKPDAVAKPDGFPVDDISKKVQDVLEPLFADCAAELGPVPPESEFPEEGRRVWQEILDTIGNCRAVAERGDWEQAGSALLNATKIFWRSSPWELPFDPKPIAQACSAYAALTKGKRVAQFAFVDAQLSFPGLDLTAVNGVLEQAVRPLHDSIQALQNRARYPLKGTGVAHQTYEALMTLDAYVQGSTEDGPAVIAAIRTIEKNDPNKIIGIHSVSLGIVAPAWEQAVAELKANLGGLLTGAALEIKAGFEASRRGRDTLSFDDYLLNLRIALDGPDGPELLAALRGEYKAALIDEFQDTDPIQYAIFSTIFSSTEDTPCFLVGDPKQAIYRFRNGDIETYVEATERITDQKRRHSLGTNYRSEKRLIDAVNELFRDREPEGDDQALQRTFLNEAIPYDGTLNAAGLKQDRSLLEHGKPQEKPMIIWHYDDGKSIAPPGQDRPETQNLWKHTAAEIRRLLDDASTTIAGKRVQAKDIAVLTGTHNEGAAIENELVARGVPVSRQGTQMVFNTSEAQLFRIVLAAMVEPRDLRRVRAALNTSLLGLSDADILQLNNGIPRALPAGWPPDAIHSPAFGIVSGDACGLEHWTIFFNGLRQIWEQNGFAAAFNDLSQRSGLRARLAGSDSGERALTNILHLSELLHQAALDERLSPEGCYAWFQEQMSSGAGGANEEHELRLETDDNAVKIMTVFKSKGLEFPIVFVPTLWRRKAECKGSLLEYHEGTQLIVEVGTDTGKDQAIAEQLQENIRLAYVALTRAKHRTVLVWGNFTAKPESHAFACLLGERTSAEALHMRFGENSAIAIRERSWEKRADEQRYHPERARGTSVFPEVPDVEKRYGHGSYSMLAPHAGERVVAETTDTAGRDRTDGGEGLPNDAVLAVAPIFAFPAGAKTGTCWHAVFEDLPFDADEPLIRSTSKARLEAFGLTRRLAPVIRDERVDVTADMVSKVLRAPLPPFVDGEPAFALKDIDQADRKDEWEFSFPSAEQIKREPLRTSAIVALLRNAWHGDQEREVFLERVKTWDRELPGGYLTGFLDLLFRRNGRYYIVDWKSNRRGGRKEDFEAVGLREEMAQHAYFLQYLFYTVAVHQYLKAAVKDYDYDSHFGGVYYVFLRGVDGDSGRGIYADRPTKALVEGLSKLLGDFV